MSPAVNGHATNGHVTNGHATNGHTTNGHGTNGYGTNRHATNGHATNGNGVNGHDEGNSESELDGPVNGVNGHASVEQQRLLVFSAFDEKATQRTLQQYTTWFGANVAFTQAKLDALAHTLAARRSHMRWRTFAIASPSKSLSSYSKPSVVVSEPATAWVFTGQGAQYVEMGWGLVDAFPVFKDTLVKVDKVYKSLGCSWSIFGR